jgi:hypothetical protein
VNTTRMARGFLWGAIATVLMTCTHAAIWAIQGRLSVHAFETQAMPAVIITKMFGPGLPPPTHLLLAMLLHMGYGGFCGAILFGLTPRVTFWKGVSTGAILWLGAHLFLQPLLGRSIFTSGSAQILAGLWFSIATHFTYGASLGLLGAWSERAAEKSGATVPSPEMRPNAANPATSVR